MANKFNNPKLVTAIVQKFEGERDYIVGGVRWDKRLPAQVVEEGNEKKHRTPMRHSLRRGSRMKAKEMSEPEPAIAK